MKKLSTIILLFAIPALLFAGSGKMKEKSCADGRRMYMSEKLNLSDEQAEQMHALGVAHQKKVIPLRADLKLAQIELDELVRAGDSSKKLDAAIKKVNELKGNLNELQVKHRVEVGKILTDEQRAMLNKHHSGRGMKHEMRRPRGGCRKMENMPPPSPPGAGDPAEDSE